MNMNNKSQITRSKQSGSKGDRLEHIMQGDEGGENPPVHRLYYELYKIIENPYYKQGVHPRINEFENEIKEHIKVHYLNKVYDGFYNEYSYDWVDDFRIENYNNFKFEDIKNILKLLIREHNNLSTDTPWFESYKFEIVIKNLILLLNDMVGYGIRGNKSDSNKKFFKIASYYKMRKKTRYFHKDQKVFFVGGTWGRIRVRGYNRKTNKMEIHWINSNPKTIGPQMIELKRR